MNNTAKAMLVGIFCLVLMVVWCLLSSMGVHSDNLWIRGLANFANGLAIGSSVGQFGTYLLDRIFED